MTNPTNNPFAENSGLWLEFGLLPASAAAMCICWANAVWAGWAGRTEGLSSLLIIPFLSLAALFSVILTPVYKTKRLEGPGRGIEVMLLVVVPLVWHWVARLVRGEAPEVIYTAGRSAGIESSLFLCLLGCVTWGLGVLIGALIGDTWPPLDDRSRFEWLNIDKTEGDSHMTLDETRRELELQTARLSRAAASRNILICAVLGMAAVAAIIPLAPQAPLIQPGFQVWMSLFAVGALACSSAFTLSIKRFDWQLHGVRVERGVLRAWLIIGILTLALIVPLGSATRFTTKHLHLNSIIPIHNSLNSRDRTAEVTRDQDEQTAEESTVKADKKRGAKSKPSQKDSKKPKDTPRIFQAIFNLFATVVAMGFVITSVLMGLSLIAALLIVVVRYLPGLNWVKGGLFASNSGLTLGQALLWPFQAIGEVLGTGLREMTVNLIDLWRKRSSGKYSIYSAVSRNTAAVATKLRQMRSERKQQKSYDMKNPTAIVRSQYRRLLVQAEKRGMERHASETPDELTTKLSNPPSLYDDVEKLTQVYTKTRYSNREPDASLAQKFQAWVRSLAKKIRPGKPSRPNKPDS